MRNLGTLYNLQGRFDEAAALFKSTIDAKDRPKSPSDSDQALAWMGLGDAFLGQGNDNDALSAYSRALEIYDGPVEGPWAPGYYYVLFEDPDGIRLEVSFVPGAGLLAEGAQFNPGTGYV
jgi:tetratricopeptide (TPR) repeat protein